MKIRSSFWMSIVVFCFVFTNVNSQCHLVDSTGRNENARLKIEKKVNNSKNDNSKKIDDIISYYHKNKLFDGYAIIKKDTEILFEKNYDTRLNSRFHLGGISRSFTSYLYYGIMNDGLFKPSHNISKYLEDFPFRLMTFEHLITQQTGIYNPYGNDSFLEEIRKKEYPTDFLYRTMLQQPLVFNPGDSTDISAGSYSIMAYLCQKATFIDYPLLLEDRIFKPMNLASTSFDHKFYYEKEVDKRMVKDSIFCYNYMGPSGIISNIDDLKLWVENFNRTYQENLDFFNITGEIDANTDMTYCWLKDKGRIINNLDRDIYYLEGTSELFQFFILIEPKSNSYIILIDNDEVFPAYDMAELLLRYL